MKRVTADVTVGEGKKKSRVRLTSVPCAPGTVEARVEQYRLLRNVADLPDLTHCGLEPFEKLTMYHDGQAWVIEAEAVVYESKD